VHQLQRSARSPASEDFACPNCGYRMWIRAGVGKHSVGNVNPEPAIRKPVPMNELQRPADLHHNGELTDEEFAELKARLLS
jgi:hypothetical protein